MKINYKKSDSLLDHQRNLLNTQNTEKDQHIIKYELVKDIRNSPLSELNAYIPKFLFTLWNQPKIVYKLLLNANSDNMKETLSDFFCNNFYENILSPNYIEHNLIFLITLLLNEEINNLNNKNIDHPRKLLNIFLNNTTCGFILEQFQKKKDVQVFFKTILINIIGNLEMSSANKEMTFDLKKLEKEQTNKKRLSDETNRNHKKLSDDFNEKKKFEKRISSQSINKDEFFDKNIIKINFEYLNDLMNNYKTNNQMVGYLLYHIGKNEKKRDIYIPEIFVKKDLENKISPEAMKEYKKNFYKVTNLINELIKNLLNNLYLMPYSIKCICKIIFSYIQKKFKRLNIFHQYALMAKFFFGKLFSPIFQNPDIGALINTFIISTTTIKNLELISKIINNFVSGNLYKNNKEEEYFTPFNNYFITKMPDLIKFFEGILKVELPSFIEKFINDELPEDFEYDFFQENPEEVVFHKSACFTVEDLYLIIELMEQHSQNIFPQKKNKEIIKLEKTFEKLSNKKNKELMKELKNNSSYEIFDIPICNKKKKENEQKQVKRVKIIKIIKYYLISEFLFNQKYNKIFNIKQETKYFNLPELKNMNNEEENLQNNIIKIKNFFCTVLYNYRTLVKTDFDGGTIESTLSILEEIKKFMKSSNNIIEGTFPSQWFINSLLDYLAKMPKDLIEDDCENIINEIQDEINKEIKCLNFEDLSLLIHKMKYANRGKIFYENAINLITDIYLNKKAQSIIEKEKIEVEISMEFNDKSKRLSIQPLNKNEKIVNTPDKTLDDKKKHSRFCNTIKLFTKSFPDLIKYQNYYNIDVLEIEKILKLPKKLNSYFNMIKEHIKTNLNITDENEFLKINDKICDYVMEKIYEKIYPINPNETDKKIQDNCEKLKWVEPKHFIEGKKNYVYDSFLPELGNYLMLITKEKSIRKKLIFVKSIFECIQKLGIFNGEKMYDIDEQIKILSYIIIKANISNMYANCEYMELFIGNKVNEIEGQNLVELKAICQYVSNISILYLNNITEEEFKQKCEISKTRISHFKDMEFVI